MLNVTTPLEHSRLIVYTVIQFSTMNTNIVNRLSRVAKSVVYALNINLELNKPLKSCRFLMMSYMYLFDYRVLAAQV